IITQEMSKYVRPWRAEVQRAAQTALLTHYDQERFPLAGPLAVDVIFTLARPKSHYRTGRNAHVLRDSPPARPTGAPDPSKLAPATEDALTEAGVWKDDAAVVEYRRLAKVYPGSDPHALDQPGALIRIHPLETP